MEIQKRSFLGYFMGTMSALIAASALGCGGGDICDVDFDSLAGAYSLTWTTHSSRYENSCFESYDELGQLDHTNQTDCTWVEEIDEQTLTMDIEITEDGDVGSAQIVAIDGDDIDDHDVPSLGVNCEMLKGELCDAPVRCTLTFGDACKNMMSSDPEEWTYMCNCGPGSERDPASAACQECKSSYDMYQSEREEYCEKTQDRNYVEFTLHVES